MKKIISIAMLIIAVASTTACATDGITLSEVNSTNYNQYVKSIPDPREENNKGGEHAHICVDNSCYEPHEEYFYSDGVDHWNVGLVYDNKIVEEKFGITETNVKPTPVVKNKVVKKAKANKPNKMTKARAKRIIRREKKITVDYLKLVDKYVPGRWYAYYIFSDGDVYIATLKRGHVQKFVQLN